ncbi:MAG TPA: CRTAC1 family protein [Candidatus Limnocylindrales bacterium]|nr:CRTAC1 family protein [Candidatus Limnocylindrales bacterium]
MSRRPLLVAGLLVLLAAVVLAGGFAAGAVRLGPSPPTTALGSPHFVEETASAGLVQTYDGDETYDVGGGLAVLDCDADGRPDVYAAGGEHPAAVYRNTSRIGGSVTFERVRAATTDLTGVTGAYPLDVDADGMTDLAVLRVGQSQLLRGLGSCRFERADEAWHATPTRGFGSAFSATWEGDAARPTLAFGTYLELDASGEPGTTCGTNELLPPDSSGVTYGDPIALAPGYCALSMLFSDWDGSGRRDLRVSNDRHYYDAEHGEEQLWRIERDAPPRLYTAEDGWALLQLWGMGIASYDVTGDGYPEVYLTSQGPNTLQTLLAGPAQPTYRDLANKHGIEGTRPATGGDPLPSTAWHPEFQDVNNDGFMDLFVSKGNVNVLPDYATRDPSDLYLGQPDGSWVQAVAEAGIAHFDRGRGAALADLNLDGLLDLVEVNVSAPVRVWRNVGTGTSEAPAPMGHWLAWRLRQPGGNRDAIGAVVETRVGERVLGRREVVVGGGHLSGQLGWTTVGLGPATEAELRVTWPDGEVGPWQRAAADGFVILERGSTEVHTSTPAGTEDGG